VETTLAIGSGKDSEPKFGRRRGGVSYIVARKKGSGMHPSENALPNGVPARFVTKIPSMIMNLCNCLGRAMAQAISRTPRIPEARVSLCGISSRQSGTGTVLSPSSSDFSCQCHSTTALHTHI
jgi:hypothetical protein